MTEMLRRNERSSARHGTFNKSLLPAPKWSGSLFSANRENTLTKHNAK
jgi:hypothetical protein